MMVIFCLKFLTMTLPPLVWNGAKLPIENIGNCTLSIPSKSLKLDFFFYVSDLKHNLISIKRLCRANNC